MSECVVRMEMPQNCGECRFRSDGWCYGIREFDPQPGPLDFEKRPSWCPIICQLPEGHGRLADKDEMLKKIENYHRYMTIGRESDPRCIIEDSPTIVPAERSES
jgi:hypothetical protein